MEAPAPKLLLAALVGLLAACEARRGPPPEARASGRSEVVLESVTFDRFERDRLVARGEAARLTLDRSRGALAADRVRVRALDPQGAPSAEVRAATATSALGGDRVSFFGGVRVDDPDGQRVLTDALEYAPRADRLRSRGPVRVLGENFALGAPGLVGHPRAGLLELDGPVTATASEVRR